MAGVTPVFLLSLPRSGSTLLQRMLAVSPEIATAPEPWFLLPLVGSTRVEGTHTAYGQQTCAAALQGLSDGLAGASGTSWPEMVSRFAGQVYDELSPAGSRYFVDKTPRYSLIAHELHEWFPEAKFVVLWRNPLAAASSFTRSISEGTWRFWRNHVDLYDGLANLVDLVRADDGDRVLTLRYEDLVTAPTGPLERIGAHLGVDIDIAAATQDFDQVPVPGRIGDHWGAARFQSLSTAPMDEWQSHYDTPVRRRWARRYLAWLGDDRLDLMGYDRADLLAEIAGQRGGRVVSDSVRAVYGSVYTRVNTAILDHRASSLWGRRPMAAVPAALTPPDDRVTAELPSVVAP